MNRPSEKDGAQIAPSHLWQCQGTRQDETDKCSVTLLGVTSVGSLADGGEGAVLVCTWSQFIDCALSVLTGREGDSMGPWCFVFAIYH